jgi:type IV pilus assembly protein PilX
MKTIKSILRNDGGSVIVAAILVLALVTIIGLAATNTSTTEMQIAANSLLYERVFYWAEAGLEHVKEGLKTTLRTPANLSIIATTGRANWSFALSGATDTTYEGGVIWIADQTEDGFSYTITVWDNDDGDADPEADVDGLIYVRSDAVGPRNARCSIETLLDANATGESITGYNAQEGAGSGKTFTSYDATPIDFSAPAFGLQGLHVGG